MSIGQTSGAQASTTEQATARAGAAAGEARNVAADVAGSVRDVAADAAQQAGDVVAQARQQVSSLMGQTRGEVQTQLETRTTEAAAGLHVLSSQLEALGQGRLEDAGPLVGYLQSAQQRVQGIASRLDEGGSQGLLRDAGAFARRRPGTFLLGAVLAGFAVGRLARVDKAVSSSQADGQLGAGTDSAGVVTPSLGAAR